MGAGAMAELVRRYEAHVPVRVRMFLSRLGLLVLVWLAVTGANAMFHDAASRPSILSIAALLFGCALGAALSPLPSHD